MFSDDMRDFCAQQTNENTRQAYTFDLLKWVAFLDGREPTREIAIAFRENLLTRLSPRSAARVFNTCRSYYRWSNGNNPFEGVKSPKRLRNATPSVPEDVMVDVLVASADTPRDRAIIALLLNGLRASEVAGLTPGDWQYSSVYNCHIIRVIGKGNKQRLVPATAETSERVSKYLSIKKNASAWLLEPLRGTERMTRRQVSEVLVRAARKAGVKALNPHALRHHYATRIWRGSKNLLALQQLLGHESPDTTQVYVHLDLGDVVNATAADPRNRKEESGYYPYQSATQRNPFQGAGGAEQGGSRIH